MKEPDAEQIINYKINLDSSFNLLQMLVWLNISVVSLFMMDSAFLGKVTTMSTQRDALMLYKCPQRVIWNLLIFTEVRHISHTLPIAGIAWAAWQNIEL